MALNPIDMKGFIPKTQELSEIESHKNVRDRGMAVAQQSEQEKRYEKEIKRVKDSEEAEKARIRKEAEERGKRDGSSKKDASGEDDSQSKKNSLEDLNISVKEKNLAVGRKIDMKI